jgi:hypothetical protein
MVLNAGLLAAASVISTFKPWGLTAYGRRSATAARTARR